MKVMLMYRMPEDFSKPPSPPTEAALAEMGKFNEALVNAGVILAGEGLHSTQRGKRIKFDGKKRAVVDGPFTEAKEMIGGFWLWQVKSMDEALEWIKRSPFTEGEIELRQVMSPEDYAPSDPTGELRAAEARLRAQSENKNKP